MPRIVKLQAFGLDALIDAEIGGFGSDVYPKGTLVQVTRLRAAESRGVSVTERGTSYVGDSPRDVEAARVGGARSIAVVSGRATHAELAAAAPTPFSPIWPIPRPWCAPSTS